MRVFHFKQLAAGLLCGCMAAVCLTACGNSDSSKGENYSEDQLPYGATIVVDKNYPISIQYDRRCLDEALMARVVDFYNAIQTQDAEKFKAVQLPLYHDYSLTQTYGGKYSDADILKLAYDTDLTDEDGNTFDFSLIDITDAHRGTVYSDTATTLELLDQIAEEKGAAKISPNVDDARELTIARYLTEKGSGERGETDNMLEEESIIALHYSGEWYLIYN
ncbi:MAG: hypothetical protein MJ062_08500 [Oscillospiraceae bacterium]|nr:hypothetical protein [Oscillospiraceae bacterium]